MNRKNRKCMYFTMMMLALLAAMFFAFSCAGAEKKETPAWHETSLVFESATGKQVENLDEVMVQLDLATEDDTPCYHNWYYWKDCGDYCECRCVQCNELQYGYGTCQYVHLKKEEIGVKYPDARYGRQWHYDLIGRTMEVKFDGQLVYSRKIVGDKGSVDGDLCAVCDCGHFYEVVHYWESWVYIDEFDCGTVCKVCHTVKSQSPHFYGIDPVKYDENGEPYYECSYCGFITDCMHDEYTYGGNKQFHWRECIKCDFLSPPEKHVYDRYKVIKPATCTEDAKLKKACVCGKTTGKTIGPKEGDPEEYFAHHTWGDKYEYAGDTHWNYCKLCGEKNHDSYHTPIDIVVHKEPTCTRNGQVSFECRECGCKIRKIYVNSAILEIYPDLYNYHASGHNFEGDPKIASGPEECSKENEGTHAVSCTRCGEVDMSQQKKHSFATYTISNGSCGDPNDPVIIGGDCECGAKLKKVYPREHVPVADGSQDTEPTCTEPGYINGHRCMICGLIYGYTEVPPLGHAPDDDPEIITKATCEKEGVQKCYCWRCSTWYNEAIPKLSPDGKHHYNRTYLNQTTCTDDGEYQDLCQYCFDSEVVSEPAWGHQLTESTKSKGKTKEGLTDDGLVMYCEVFETVFTCNRCSYKSPTQVYKAYYTTGRNSKYQIVKGKYATITNLKNGVHLKGQMAKDGGVYFRNQVLKGLHEVTQEDKKNYQYAKTKGSVVITFTEEFLATIENGSYDLVVINGSEYWPMIVRIKNHKIVGLEDQKISDSNELTAKQMDKLLKKYADKGIQVKETKQAGYQPPKKQREQILLTLEDVEISLSAKKLTLQAALTINGEKTKGMKVTFTLCGKTFTAKTNKNGVAKVMIEEKELQELLKGKKKGEKVTWQAAFDGETAEKTVILKK